LEQTSRRPGCIAATTHLPGCAYGDPTVARSPVTMEELGELKAYPFTEVVRPLLEKAKASPEERDAMLQAWTKAFTLQVTLYSRAYVPEGDW
jgi:Protoglobin